MRIATSWEGAGGVGSFSSVSSPRAVLRKIYAEELDRLDAYARERDQPR